MYLIEGKAMQSIKPCLWFDSQAEEAVNFYCSIFKNSAVIQTSRYGDGAPFEKGTVLTIGFTLDGQQFLAMNGGPMYSFTPAISLVKQCETQEEIDYYWERLCDGGKPLNCGWLTDRYGVTWQIVPSFIGDMLTDPDDERTKRVTTELLKMVKLDIAKLKEAWNS